MKTIKMVVTPAMAQDWLENHNHINRPIRENYVRYLIEEIYNNRWHLSHQGIALRHDGELIDGQHRLWAIMLAEKSVPVLITTYAKDDNIPPMDDGVGRNITDITHIPRPVAVIYSALLTLCKYATSDKVNRISPDDVMLLHKAFKEDAEKIVNCTRSHAQFYTSAPVKAAALYCMHFDDSAYVIETYRDLAETNMAYLPSVGQALYRRRNNGLARSTKGHSSITNEIFLNAAFVFHKGNANAKDIRITSKTRTTYLMEIKTMVEKVLAKHHKPAPDSTNKEELYAKISSTQMRWNEKDPK